MLVLVFRNQYDYLVKQGGGAADNIQVPVGNRVKAARAKYSFHIGASALR